MNILVFDIETIPDIQLGKKTYGISSASDNDALEEMRKIQTEKSGSDFFPLFLHRIVTISIVLKTSNQLKIWSLGETDSPEEELLQRFFDGIEQYTPTIVSWNGTNFDLPVIHYRALKHGTVAGRYWENGKHDQNFKWNNYINRYHDRHSDVMDQIAGFSSRAITSLENISLMLGLPGKMGIDGSKVYDMFTSGNIQDIRDYCEIDVLNTYLVFLRFELIRNNISENKYLECVQEARDLLSNSPGAHFTKYLQLWDNS